MKRSVILAGCILSLAACTDAPAPLDPGSTPARTLATGVEVDPALADALATASATDRYEVIVSFGPGTSTAEISAAIQTLDAGVIEFKHLPMVAALATPDQIASVQTLAGVQSLYLNTAMEPLNREGVGSIQADQVHAEGITGAGVGIAILDTGVDGNHPDLAFGSKLVQNVRIGADTRDLYTFAGRDSVTGLKTPKPAKKGAELFVEDLVTTDTDNGHGTHVAGSAAGSGTASEGGYRGVAPGAHVIGVAAAAGPSLPTVMILAGFDYIIENQREYNIQVVNNSWGSSGDFRPASPVAIATREVHAAGITVVFAAGNCGTGGGGSCSPTTASHWMNPHSVAPWVISVAAGCKLSEDPDAPAGSPENPTNSRSHCVDGRSQLLADFSSRGRPGDDMYRPDITAPGVHIVSTRSLTGLYVNGLAANHDLRICNIPDGLEVYYTCIDGTSMASPHIAGLVALLEEASGGTLTPDQALTALTSTARTMDGYGAWEVGAGYADALAAVRSVQP